ncbi:N-acetylgalactosamine-6-O-sulfatase [Afipia felis]
MAADGKLTNRIIANSREYNLHCETDMQNAAGNKKHRKLLRPFEIALLASVALSPVAAQAQQPQRPNIVVIWGDDIGFWNLSTYSRGTMGYRTPNIDRIGKEGAIFTDHYAQPSCTAGRAAFITGQLPIRSGLTTVGSVGSPQGLKFETVTLAEVLKQQGYITGQFGKNHLGDRNEHLPTVHGFDEFLGNLYHLNTEEEPEDFDYPTDNAFKKAHAARGVLHCYATLTDQPGEDPRFGKWGKQRCEDTGTLTRARMVYADDEFIDASFKFMDKAVAEKRPFFTWIATSRQHVFIHPPQEYLDQCRKYTSGDDVSCAGMLQHDHDVGVVLKKLDDLGIANNTIVIYSTDNGPEHNTFPDGGTTPYRGEKMTTWEAGMRVPMLVRWPGHIPAGEELNGIQSQEDVFTTLAAAAGVTDVRERAARGDKFGTDTLKRNYIDGVNNLDYWTGKSAESSRNAIFYYAESRLQALRVNQWKWHFYTRECYFCPTVKLEIPTMFNIRQDPFESYESAQGMRQNLQMRKQGLYHLGGDVLAEHLRTLKEYPPAQIGGSLSVGEIMEQILNQRGD